MGDVRSTRRELAALDTAICGEPVNDAGIATVVREVRAGMPAPDVAFLASLDARLATLAQGKFEIAHLVGDGSASQSPAQGQPATPGRHVPATARGYRPSWARRHPAALAALACAVGGFGLVAVTMPAFLGQRQSISVQTIHDKAAKHDKDELSLPRYDALAGREAKARERVIVLDNEGRRAAKSGYVNRGETDATTPASASFATTDNASVSVTLQPPLRSVKHAASITIATKPGKVQSLVGRVNQIVTEAGGFVAASNFEVVRGDGRARIDLRVPTDELPDVIERLTRLGTPVRLQHESVDITEPVEDARDRLRQARAELDGVLRQLARATNSLERAQLRREAQALRRDVASLRGHRNRLVREASQVPVAVTIQAGESADRPASTTRRNPTSIGGALDRSRTILAFMLATALIGVTSLAPPVALLALVVWLWRRRYPNYHD